MDIKDFRWVFMPYCLQRLSNGRYIILNRDYKPLGTTSPDWVEYETHPSAVRMSITAKTAASLSTHGKPDTDRIFLYDDGSSPANGAEQMRAYMEKLSRLAMYTVKYED
ncbi:hypothetical protein GXB81_29675 [Paraburkholderia sp. Ac-20336]|uniref:hypothetical protein n=1 Tax=unclassified Paraburkholderia TaxID=2615204 RepID=UPI00141FC81A|nr:MULTISPECIES: hypothetical protein [unclassified Paraburkholderia]MBN3807177.1 hypothetical protein [Paraburkholderia sp. Ac-20336]MBN3851568.1 hypothetical protein [Paraburkholderia sp. Ac-20342]NIF80653.1 hypothetical protein [Paraburkholderia sp. Cy-641]